MNPLKYFQGPRIRISPIKRPSGSIAQRNSNLKKDENNRFLIISRVQRQPFQRVNIRTEKLPGESGIDNLPKPED
jgi:hypothetical protein